MIPTKDYFLRSPFLYNTSEQTEKTDQQSDDNKQKKEKLKKILSKIILDKLGDNMKSSVSTRGLISLLSLVSVAEAEEETKLVPNLSNYQTGLPDSTRVSGKPYFHTVDVVVGGLTNSGAEK